MQVTKPDSKEKREVWSHSPDGIEKRLMARALKERPGVVRAKIFRECLLAGLRKYAAKKDLAA
jgi:hypothetical protein